MCLLGKIDRFLRETQMPPTKFGRLAVRDPRLVGDLKRGRDPGPALIARVEAFIAAQAAEPRA
jgi:hypothetical protein